MKSRISILCLSYLKLKTRRKKTQRMDTRTYNDIDMSMKRRKMQRGIALICKVRVIHIIRIILDYALDQQDIIEDDGPSKTHRHRQFDPGDLFTNGLAENETHCSSSSNA